jgi:hypothetical protein
MQCSRIKIRIDLSLLNPVCVGLTLLTIAFKFDRFERIIHQIYFSFKLGKTENLEREEN